MIIEQTSVDPEIETRLRNGQLHGTTVQIGLTLDDIDDLAGHVAAQANHTNDKRVRRILDALHDRAAKLEAQYTDEEKPILTPTRTEDAAPDTVHRPTGSVPCVYLLLHEAASAATG